MIPDSPQAAPVPRSDFILPRSVGIGSGQSHFCEKPATCQGNCPLLWDGERADFIGLSMRSHILLSAQARRYEKADAQLYGKNARRISFLRFLARRLADYFFDTRPKILEHYDRRVSSRRARHRTSGSGAGPGLIEAGNGHAVLRPTGNRAHLA